MEFPILLFGVSRLLAIDTSKFFMVGILWTIRMPSFSNKIRLNLFAFVATMTELSIEDSLSITPLQLSSAQTLELTSFMDRSSSFLGLGLALDWTPYWAYKKFKNSFSFYNFFENYCIFNAFHLNVLVVVNFLPQILHDIDIFGYRSSSLFCVRNIHLDFENLSKISYPWIGLSDSFPNVPSHCKKHTWSTNFKGHWIP